ncbi:hypothetical protein ACFT9M_15275 [Micromonospora purpureochromogenes]|uniref:hypothetical protein n=1 Tax=Micromonospora purpureochromogenes TaxID=47872 RepID=UPI0036445447
MLETYIGHVGAQARRSESNRLSLLHLHAAAACYIAPGFALISEAPRQTPTFALVRLIPGAPVSLAVLFGVGGLILGIATIRRRPRWEIAGLSLMLAWYVIVAGTTGTCATSPSGSGRSNDGSSSCAPR